MLSNNNSVCFCLLVAYDCIFLSRVNNKKTRKKHIPSEIPLNNTLLVLAHSFSPESRRTHVIPNVSALVNLLPVIVIPSLLRYPGLDKSSCQPARDRMCPRESFLDTPWNASVLSQPGSCAVVIGKKVRLGFRSFKWKWDYYGVYEVQLHIEWFMVKRTVITFSFAVVDTKIDSVFV